jgi:hypothetical protein
VKFQFYFSIENYHLNDQIKKIIVINRPVKETKDENGFTIIGITDFLLGL